MSATRAASLVANHFATSLPRVKATYSAILKAARSLGPVQEEAKKTSIHLVRTTAFAGVATRKDALILTLKATADIRSPRVHRHERASANRWHLELRLISPSEVDRELRGWLAQAYDIAE